MAWNSFGATTKGPFNQDTDREETAEWLESLDEVIEHGGIARAEYLRL